MNAARALVVATLTVGGLVGVASHAGSEQAGIGTAVTVQRGLTPCDLTLDEVIARDGGLWLSDQLVERCDYRVTHEPCQEDELCAQAQIRATGDFER